MYARSYYGEDVNIPENYDGTAFSEPSSEPELRGARLEPVKSEIKFSPKEPSKSDIKFSPDESAPDTCEKCAPCECEGKDSGGIFGIDLKGIFGGIFSGSGLSRLLPSGIGTEEILIIGIALFLLFSPSRDIECALLLLALVFIK